jgi:hypothetical protein
VQLDLRPILPPVLKHPAIGRSRSYPLAEQVPIWCMSRCAGIRKSAELSEHLDSIGGVNGGGGSGPTAGLISSSFAPFAV